MNRLIFYCVALWSSLLLADPEPQRLLYMSEGAPVFIRLHIEIDGGSYESPWHRFVDQLFADLDEDNDGTLRGNETSRIPTSQQLARSGLSVQRQATRPTNDVTKEQLGEYLRKVSGGPFTVTMPQPRTDSRLRFVNGPQNNPDVDIFKRLDLDEDGKLSDKEFAMTVALQKLDIDDDESISAAELQPAFNPYVRVRSSGQTVSTNTSPFVHLDSSQSPTRIVRQLIERYDRAEGKDNKLSQQEVGMPAEPFAKLDIDGDGHLDFDELQQFVRNPSAQVEVTVRLGKLEKGQEMVELTKADKDLPFEGSVRKSTDGLATLVVCKVQIEIGPTNGGRAAWQNVEATYKRMLQRYDQDNNAYLEKSETDRSPLQNNFEFIDRDGDGKIFEKELIAYGKQVAAASQARTSLTISDQGNKLFQILDLNRDNRLNARELQAARNKIAVWDEDKDGQVTQEEIPRHWRLALSRGIATGVGAQDLATYAPGNQQVPQPTRGPVWFRKMDRNRDGDVSQREFLGATRDFEKLDQNGDKLIDANEASAPR